MPSTDRTPAHVSEARYLGHDAGLTAASWLWLEMTEADARSILTDVDPEVADRYPGPNLSGEFADDPTPRSLATECGVGTVGATEGLVTVPSGGSWHWHERSDGRYQVTSAEVSTYGFALSERELSQSASESMRAVWAAIRAEDVDQAVEECADAWEAAAAAAFSEALQGVALRVLGRTAEAQAVENELEARAAALRELRS